MDVGHNSKRLEFIDDRSEVGAKSLRLAQLKRIGIPVPRGVAVPELDAVSYGNDKDWLKELLKDLRFPFLVRSSANIEDSPLASFAGQFLSVGPVTTYAGLIKAIEEVLAHKASAPLKSYLDHYNISEAALSVHVLIQEYVPPLYSGVVFTPGRATSQYVIEYARGGEGVTAGVDYVSRILVNGKTNTIDTHIAYGGKISTARIHSLMRHVKRITQRYSAPQDIEWIYDGEKIHIVQARPITVIPETTDSAVLRERRRLRNMFGERMPTLSAHEFSEGVGKSTPLTTSVFQKIYEYNGAWHKVMKRYGYTIPPYISSMFVVEAFGRLYINKDGEAGLLYGLLPFTFDSKKNKRMWSTSVREYLTTFPHFCVYLWGSVRLRIDTYLFIKHKNNILDDLTEKVRFQKKSTFAAVQDHVEVITEDIMPVLFRTSLYQQYIRDRIEAMTRKNVKESDREKIMESGVKDSITAIVRSESLTDEDRKKQLGIRGYYELEFSSPRFSDTEDLLERLLEQTRRTEVEQLSSKSLREKVISGYQSALDRQSLTTYFEIHDTLAQIREDVHALWAQEASRIHTMLLHRDRIKELYNHIWYYSLEEIGKSSISHNTLLARRTRAMALKNIPIPAYIEGELWSTIGTVRPLNASLSVYLGRGLVSGTVEGVVGTLDDINAGKEISILLTQDLDPALTIVFPLIQGIVAEVGGSLSHAAIIAREYGIPVVTLPGASTLIETGSSIRINGTTGNVDKLET